MESTQAEIDLEITKSILKSSKQDAFKLIWVSYPIALFLISFVVYGDLVALIAAGIYWSAWFWCCCYISKCITIGEEIVENLTPLVKHDQNH